MAQSQFSYSRGDQDGDVAITPTGGTAPGADIRISWDDALSREEVYLGLDVIERVILKSDWPL